MQINALLKQRLLKSPVAWGIEQATFNILTVLRKVAMTQKTWYPWATNKNVRGAQVSIFF